MHNKTAITYFKTSSAAF